MIIVVVKCLLVKHLAILKALKKRLLGVFIITSIRLPEYALTHFKICNAHVSVDQISLITTKLQKLTE